MFDTDVTGESGLQFRHFRPQYILPVSQDVRDTPVNIGFVSPILFLEINELHRR
jgi:hypothetical protein